MKAASVTRPNPYMSAYVRLTDDNKVFEDYPLLGLKKGDDFVKFYHQNRNNFVFDKAEYYNMEYYLEEEVVQRMKEKNPVLSKMIEVFDLGV